MYTKDEFCREIIVFRQILVCLVVRARLDITSKVSAFSLVTWVAPESSQAATYRCESTSHVESETSLISSLFSVICLIDFKIKLGFLRSNRLRDWLVAVAHRYPMLAFYKSFAQITSACFGCVSSTEPLQVRRSQTRAVLSSEAERRHAGKFDVSATCSIVLTCLVWPKSLSLTMFLGAEALSKLNS